MGIRELRANIVANAQGFISEMNRASQAVGRLGNDTGAHTARAGNSISSLARNAAALGAAYMGFDMLAGGVKSVATSMVMGNADMETYQNTLSTLLKSNEKGKEMLDWAVQFAAETPFEIPEIVDATSKLTAYGMNAKDVMTDIGNMASIMGKPLDQAVEAVADAQTGELERLKEFGITKQMLVDKAQQLYKKELVNSKGQITDQKLLNDSLMAIMKERYSGGMELASTSFKGMLSNFQDALSSIVRSLGEPLFNGLKNILGSVNPIMSELVAMFQGKSNDVRGAFEKALGKETVATAIDIFTKIGNVGKGAFDLLKAGWEVVSPIFPMIGSLLAPVGAAFLSIASEVGKFISKLQEMGLLAPIIAGVAAGIGAYMLVIRGVVLALNAWNAITKVATALQVAWNVAMSMNPIGLIIGLIVGLGVAIYMAYQKSETFRNLVNTLWDGMKAAWEAVANFFTTTIPAWWQQAVQWFEQGKQWVSEKWNSIWTSCVEGWNSFVATINGYWTAFITGIGIIWDTAKAYVTEKWNAIWTGCVDAWNAFVMIITMAWTMFSTTVTTIFSTIWNGIVTAWDTTFAALQLAFSTVQMWIVTIWTAIKDAVMMVVTPMWDAIKMAFEIGKGAIMAVWDGLTGFAVATWENIKLLVLGIISVFMGLFLFDWEAIKLGVMAIWDAIWSQAQLIWNTIVNTISTIVSAFVAIAVALWEGFKGSVLIIWEALKTGVTTIVSALSSALSATWEFIKSTAISVWEWIKSTVINLVTTLKDGAVNGMNALKDGAINAWNATKSAAQATWEWIKSTVVNLVNNLKEGAINALNNLKQGAIDAWNNIKSSAVSTWENIKSSVINAANNLKQGAIDAFNNLKSSATSAVQNTKQSVVDGFNNMKDSAVNAVTNMYNSIKSWFSNIWNSAKEAANNLKSAWTNLDLTSIGRNIIEGLYNGITGAANKVINKAREIASSVKDSIKGILGIASPSKVMKKYGGWTGEGLAIGLDKTKSMVSQSARNLADAMAAPIEATTDMSATGELRTYNEMTHTIDFKNVPQGMTKEELIDGVSKSLSHPKVLRALDKATGENRLAYQRTPKGAM
ncbi:putative tail tape measure protein [Bacillus phage PBC5]|nr:putative tail tape measure protein [Bacillus phage PBC5]